MNHKPIRILYDSHLAHGDLFELGHGLARHESSDSVAANVHDVSMIFFTSHWRSDDVTNIR